MECVGDDFGNISVTGCLNFISHHLVFPGSLLFSFLLHVLTFSPSSSLFLTLLPFPFSPLLPIPPCLSVTIIFSFPSICLSSPWRYFEPLFFVISFSLCTLFCISLLFSPLPLFIELLFSPSFLFPFYLGSPLFGTECAAVELKLS